MVNLIWFAIVIAAIAVMASAMPFIFGQTPEENKAGIDELVAFVIDNSNTLVTHNDWIFGLQEDVVQVSDFTLTLNTTQTDTLKLVDDNKEDIRNNGGRVGTMEVVTSIMADEIAVLLEQNEYLTDRLQFQITHTSELEVTISDLEQRVSELEP